MNKSFNSHVLYFLSIGIIMLLSGCTRQILVPVESSHTEYRDNIKEIHYADSVSDNRLVFIKGDTVIEMRDRVKWRERILRDSIFINRTDTIQQAYPVERRLTVWEQVKMNYGGMAIGGLIILISIAAYRLIRKYIK